MLTKDIRRTIDNARDVLVGKIPNPQSQIEQITIAMIYKFMDDMDIESVELGGERQFFVEELSEYAWSKIMSQQLGNEARMNLYTEALDKLQLSSRIPKLFRDIFKGAYLPFRDGQTLTLFLKEINDLSYNNSENLGNGFEYLLSIMGAQGDAGQFRTPRHIIDFIVDVVKPTKADTILDPACGTAGFLISAYKNIQKFAEETKQPLTPQERTALTENIQGYDISPDMVKLALVNMYLHKFKDPKIYEYDTLTNQSRWEDYFDCILANPPFMTPKGGIQPHNKFGVKANRSEVLFVDYIMEHLNSTGRAGVIVPEGIVFQSANAYKELRKKLVDEKYLYAVVSLPSGVFNPYSGVKTSILFLDRQLAKKTDKVLFVEIQNDGFDLGAQRRETPDKNDLPKALDFITQWQIAINTQTEFTIKSKLLTVVEKSKLAESGEYNLIASRYKDAPVFSSCNWNMVKLGDLLDYEQPTNYIVESVEYNDNYKTPVLTAGQSFILGYTNEKNGIFNSLPVIIFDDFTTSIKFVDFPFKVKSSAMKILKLNDMNIANIKYIYYVMQNIQFDSSTHKRYWISEYTNIEIPLPPLEVQEEIVKELDEYQAVIDGAQKIIDNWKPTLSINLNWEKVKIGDLCSLSTGGTPTSTVPEYYNNGNIKWLVSGDIHKGQIYDCDGRITEEGMNNSNAKYLPENSVLIALNGQGKTRGTVALLKTKATCNQSLVAITPNDDKVLISEFLYYYLKSLYKYIRSITGDSQRSGLNMPIIREIEIRIPSVNMQKEIVSKIKTEEKIVEDCKKLIELHKEKLKTKIKSIWGNEDE